MLFKLLLKHIFNNFFFLKIRLFEGFDDKQASFEISFALYFKILYIFDLGLRVVFAISCNVVLNHYLNILRKASIINLSINSFPTRKLVNT